MTSSMSTILIFGGTGGIGESFARAFHNMGKNVIITGRRESRLAQLAKELPGLETYPMDNSDLAALPGHVKTLLSKYPAIDTVWVNSGIQYQGNLLSLDNFSDEKIIKETHTNMTAPIILARHFMPHLLSLGREATFMITSSGLAFVPAGVFPVYCATKAAIHSFLVGLRESLKDTNVNVIEIAPPYVRTDLDAANRMDKIVTPMELDEYTSKTMEILEKPAREIKEAAVGFAEMVSTKWREAYGPVLNMRHSTG
ncbi:uncharacterized protein Z520_00977 [Fonsecaea multimorphosa CBS 102226]|uniref:Oxidoreductase n=1 Tax=Fonsecaea multimorphosa CBS 102226 TaxID=1442371 RepID=A0A0D2IZL7_9EURO|nr:uncharacterized protein Z520_00977 [Fonsecaea multimorphosa CBS 102226]KIY02512.1 hypothetical protein Z520_00977 [Fonsecaea multimorphosa CBS 102226]OAL31379.1 hypothetical protein AYO22_00971 [Fonsecaea multimorphosa]